MAIKKVSGKNAQGCRGVTDWRKVKTMTDEEIKAAALSDPNSRELKDYQLAEFRKGNQ